MIFTPNDTVSLFPVSPFLNPYTNTSRACSATDPAYCSDVLRMSALAITSMGSSEVGSRAAAVGAGTGCPYCWCLTQRQMTIAQFMIGSAITTIGFPFCVAIDASLFTKVLGDIPQVREPHIFHKN